VVNLPTQLAIEWAIQHSNAISLQWTSLGQPMLGTTLRVTWQVTDCRAAWLCHCWQQQ